MESYYHWKELKSRLIYTLLGISLTIMVAYTHQEILLNIILSGIIKKGLYLIYTDLTEAFIGTLKVSVIVSVIMNIPLCSYQIREFLKSGLYEKEKRRLTRILGLWNITIYSLIYVWNWSLKIWILPFFLSFQTESLEYLGKLNEFINFLGICIMGIMVLPIIMIGCYIYWCKRAEDYPRKTIVITAFIIASILTPPDVISQIILAGIMIGILELSLWLALLWQSYNKISQSNKKTNS